MKINKKKKVIYARVSKALELIENKKSRILELGTGGGELFSELVKKGNNVVGLDISPNENLIKKGFQIIKHDLNKGLPFKDSKFDVVVGIEVLEHLYNPYEMMKEIRKVLRPGGYAILSMPNTDSLFQRIGQLYERRRDKLDIYWHHYQPSMKSIRHLISTQLRIEKERYVLSFNRLGFLDSLSKTLIRLNKNKFCGSLMVKARKV